MSDENPREEYLNATKRPTNAYMESVLFNPVKCLDYGSITALDYMGNEDAIDHAARTSYGRGTRKVSDVIGLIRYLLRNHHTTPFEMCEIKYHVKLPIFVARQWIRHRTANVNEYSARYSILDKEFYVPAVEDIQPQANTNRQGREGFIDPIQAAQVQELLRQEALSGYRTYQMLLDEPVSFPPDIDPANKAMIETYFDKDFPGIARELARMSLSLNYYTQWIWKTDVHNLLHFLGLRTDPHAQKEIRVYADIMADQLMHWMPNVWQAWQDYQMQALNISGPVLQKLIHHLDVDTLVSEPIEDNVRISPREWRELIDRLRTLKNSG